MGVTATVLGASGFSGGELARLLAGHGAIEPAVLGAARRAGEDLGRAHPHLAGLGLELVDLRTAASAPAEVCFSCLPPGALAELLPVIAAGLIVDLADDFRDEAGWVYGLTEFARPEVRSAARVANPGCYPTASLLCLLPFARAGLVESPVVIDALSGVSGAGRKTEDRLLFSVLEGGASAYGTTSHRHVPEIERGLASFGSFDARVSFTPHLVPMARGVLVTARAGLSTNLGDDEALAVLAAAYEGEPFVEVVEEWPATKAVAGSNRALVSARVDDRNGMVICSAAIDNLGKGAAGQAIQNANLALGLEETTGLEARGVWP